MSFENTVGKGEIARNEQFLLFPQCFLPVWRILGHFLYGQNCCLQTLSVWKSLKFVIWELHNAFLKSIDPCQPVQPVKADSDENFSLSFNFLHVKRAV